MASRPIWDAKQICKEFAEGVGLCVSFTETEFIYDTGKEPGFIVGLINYPRHPHIPEIIQENAIVLAGMLKDAYQQERVTIVCTDTTFMLGDSNEPDQHV
jgi:hypothetical protein